MAIVSQIINMTSSYVPYERPPQPMTLWSAIPRGLQSFVTDSQQIDLKPINDDFILSLRATLPPNFGYVLMDVHLDLAGAAMFQWSAIMSLNLQNYFRAPGLSVGLSSTWRGVLDLSEGLTSDTRSSTFPELPSFPIIGTPGTSGALINITAIDGADPAAGTGVVNAYISFWQFDLEQIRKFPINSPLPVQSR